ncbi:MAG TPA: tripartite tricarboxylate transporter substrate binding protein [Burkholderiales bacterium]|nr:tripartite tricarboxylate transporter substrate binding protein [Burkholderiales bacterium]
MKRIAEILGLAALASTLWAAQARADDYPDRPIKYIAVFPPGGPTDTLARLVAPRLAASLGQPVVVENRPGAGGSVGAGILAKSVPDGYTIGAGTISSHAINVAVYPDLSYDPIRDFAPITMLATLPNVLVVHPGLKVERVRELIDLLRSHGDKYSFGSGGNGTSEHLSGELFEAMAKVRIQHVPYKGSGPMMPDLLSGVLPISFVNVAAVRPYLASGRLRALAVTSAGRSSVLPGIPTMAEAGLAGYDITGWQALFAPANTPKRIVDRLYTDVAKILRDPDVVDRIHALGADPGGMAPQDLAALVRADIPRLGRIVKESGARAD